jgi:hypothetical protein
MSRVAYVKNVEPAWVQYIFTVPVPDDVADDDIAAYAEGCAREAHPSAQIASGPEVRGQIDGMDQEFHYYDWQADAHDHSQRGGSS